MKRRAVHHESTFVHDAGGASRAIDALSKPVTCFDPPDVLAAVKARARERRSWWTGFPRLAFAGATALAAVGCAIVCLVASSPDRESVPMARTITEVRQPVRPAPAPVAVAARRVQEPEPGVRSTVGPQVRRTAAVPRRGPIRRVRPAVPRHDVVIRYVAEAPPEQSDQDAPCGVELRPEPTTQPARVTDGAATVVRAVMAPEGGRLARPDTLACAEIALMRDATDARIDAHTP